MPVTNSTIVEDARQRDGRRRVRERHELDDGSVEEVTYLAEAEADISEALILRAQQIDVRPPPEPPERFYSAADITSAFTTANILGDVNLLLNALTAIDAGPVEPEEPDLGDPELGPI